MKVMSLVILAFLALVSAHKEGEKYCTKVTKKTDIAGLHEIKYNFGIIQGQRTEMRPLRCTNPPDVGYAEAEVCDSAAPPLVAFTIVDDYIKVIRQDPAGKFSGKATITVTQKCNHKTDAELAKNYNVNVTEIF